MNNETIIESVISVAEMARQLEMSRARLYQLIDQNVMLPPAFSVATRKPLYTESMAQKNMEVKKRNVGINGQIVMFYRVRNLPQPAKVKKIRKHQMKTKKKTQNNEYLQLINDLKGLGLTEVTSVQVESAIKNCYPFGISQVDEDEVLRTIFRQIKRQNTELNVRA